MAINTITDFEKQYTEKEAWIFLYLLMYPTMQIYLYILVRKWWILNRYLHFYFLNTDILLGIRATDT